MRKILFSILLCIVANLIIGSSELWAQPSEDSLNQAWETLQRSDPKIVTLEKLGDRRYKFKTEYFLYAGELKIKDATVDGSWC